MQNKQTAICIAEDRAECEVAVKILIASLLDAGVRVPIEVTFPPASDQFKSWVNEKDTVNLSCTPIPNASFWNVKPQALCAVFDKGYEHAIWIDSDIIIANAKFANVIDLTGQGRFVTTEEPELTLNGHVGSKEQTIAWGLPLGRIYTRQINSGVVGCSKAHLGLLHKWREIIESDHYRELQKVPYQERPFHAFGDQNVLCALLGSEEFQDLDVAILKEGIDIIQHMSPACYKPGHRVRSLFYGMPPIIHAQGPKPWRFPETPGAGADLAQRKTALESELSPYRFAARALYKRQGWTLPDWLTRSSVPGVMLSAIVFNHWSLAGLPSASVNYYGSVMKIWLKSGRRNQA